MKKATQKTIFKLLSLVLTLAMVFAVATIPTLTASADEVTYATKVIKDFDEEENGYHIVDKKDYIMSDVLLKAGNTYHIHMKYKFFAIDELQSPVLWFGFAFYNSSLKYDSYQGAVNDGTTITDTWKTANAVVTPTSDFYFGFTTNDGIYIDYVQIVDVTETNESGVYVAVDGTADCENEVLLCPGASNTTLSYEQDDTYGTVASFNVSSTSASQSVSIPVAMEYGKTYQIMLTYKSALVGSNTSYWWRLADSTSKDLQITSMDNNKGVWTTKTATYTCNTEGGFTFVNFDTASTTLNIKLASFSVLEVKESTSTNALQSYDFDSNNINFTSNTNSSLKTVERDNYKTRALVFDSVSGVNVNSINAYANLDYNLVAGTYYKVSFDYKGVSSFRILLHSGGWGTEMYQSDSVVTSTSSGIMLNSGNGWSRHESVFCAKYNSSGLIFIDAYVDDNAVFCIDNVVVEKYIPTNISVNYEDDSDYIYNFYDSYNNTATSAYSVVEDPKNAENNVLKFNGAGSVRYYYFSSMPMKAGHTYYISFDYYGGKVFARDIATTGNGVSTSGTWITPSANEWKKNITTYTVTEEDNNGMFILLCNGTEDNYFDNFFIADITDSYSPAENEEYNFDFEDESEVLIETNYNAVTDLAFEENADYGRVAKLSFASGGSGVVGKTYIPYTMKDGTTYKVSITYNADAWTGISWADKDNAGNQGANGINYMNKWATETRYVTGADDMPYFFVVSPKSETNITIANITITPAGGLDDMNGDGELNAVDITLMRNRILGARDDSKMFEKYADNNADTVVDIRDLVTLNNRTK